MIWMPMDKKDQLAELISNAETSFYNGQLQEAFSLAGECIMDNKMRIMAEEFESTDTGEKVTGITVMIDGKLKQVFDAMIKKSDGEKSYLEMLQEVLVMGIDEYIKRLK